MAMIRENIRSAYKSLGISQTKLAWNIGISRQRLSRLMCDESLFTIGVLDKIAGACGVTRAELLGYDDEANDKLMMVSSIATPGRLMVSTEGELRLSDEETNKYRDDML